MSNNYVSSMRAQDGSMIKLECHDALHSTSKLARAYAKIGYPDRYVIFAEHLIEAGADGQAKEVGEKGIYMSCILRPSIFPSQAALISSLSAAATATALGEHTSKNIGIGWVSNIYCDGKMIGNISIEGRLDNFTSYEYLIINFSLALSDDNFPPRVTDLIKKVFEKDNSSIGIIIAKDILNKFFLFYSNRQNHTKFMDIYGQKFIMRGTKVAYNTDGKRKSGKVLGVDPENCALLVETRTKDVIRISTPSCVNIPKIIKKRRRRRRA